MPLVFPLGASLLRPSSLFRCQMGHFPTELIPMEARFGFHSLGYFAPITNPAYRSRFVSVQTGLILWNNRGLGYSRRVRFFSPPENTIHTLQGSQ